MANIPTSEKTHKQIKELRIEMSYNLKKDFTQNNILELMISRCTVDALIDEYKKINGIDTNSAISIPEIAEMDEIDEE